MCWVRGLCVRCNGVAVGHRQVLLVSGPGFTRVGAMFYNVARFY